MASLSKILLKEILCVIVHYIITVSRFLMRNNWRAGQMLSQQRACHRGMVGSYLHCSVPTTYIQQEEAIRDSEQL